MDENQTLKQKVIYIVSQIPKGKIMAYSHVANLIGSNARAVGFILTGMSVKEAGELPWQRVVNKDGFISASKLGEKGIIQEEMLKAEAIEVKDFQIINPERYWYKINIENKSSLF